MKYLFLSLTLLLVTFESQAESIMKHYYTIVSDEFDKSVEVGTCLLKGRAVDFENQPILNGVVANFDRSRSCVTDAKGNFSLILSSKDTSVFFYHIDYGEVVIGKYDFKSQHKIVVEFHSMAKQDYPIMEEKPVIYLYAEKSTDVKLQLLHSNLTFTYPSYADCWSVQANTNGNLIDLKSGKVYPYLFWEGQKKGLNFSSENGITEGFLIDTDSTISFLENSLTVLGLNQKEQTDFITYWGPRLIKKKYAFVQFLVDEKYSEKIAPINLSPKADSERRIYLLFQSLDNPFVFFEHTQQELKGFNRKGLTLVEWGGSELDFSKIEN